MLSYISHSIQITDDFSFWIFSHYLDLSSSVLINKGAHILVEIWSFHANEILVLIIEIDDSTL